MSKAYVILPASEVRKFNQWTYTITKENRQQCSSLINKHAMMMTRRAMMFAPVNFGFLRASIGRSFTHGSLQATVSAGGQGKGVNVNYAPYVEFGTGTRVVVPDDVKDYAIQFKGAGLRKVNNRAQPYFFPAVRLGFREMMIELNKMGFK
jgi:hypothetical protein